MELQIAQRRQAKIKLGIQGCSGSGKTMSALLLAYGLCQDWSKVVVIDTENYSASLYAHLGPFMVLNISAPYSPEKYIEAISFCEKAGVEVIILDSISHEWEGSGGILDIHSNMQGNSFTNWSKLTPRHNAFVQAILQSSCHVIGTIRSKQEYVLSEKNGKQVPEKVGLKGVTREGMDYELTIVFDINIKHLVSASKDRTGLFMDQPEFKINSSIGEKIAAWCKDGVAPELQEEFSQRINDCKSFEELTRLYYAYPDNQLEFKEQYAKRKKELLPQKVNLSPNQKFLQNGNGSIKQ